MLSFLSKRIRLTAASFLAVLTVITWFPAITLAGKSPLLDTISSAASCGSPIPEGKYLYKFDWNGVPSAETEVTVSMKEGEDGPLYCFEGTAQTSKFVDIFWKLRARVVAVVDALSGRTLKIDVDDRQNERVKKTETVFNYGSAEAYYTRWKKEKARQKTIKLEGNTIDPASLTLILCQQPLKVGDTGTFTVLLEDDAYALEYKVAAEEKITVAGYEFDALRIEPRFCKISDKKSNKPPRVRVMLLWLSDTEPRIPLKMKSKTFIGYVNGELVTVSPNERKS